MERALEIVPTPEAERLLGRSSSSRRRDVFAGCLPPPFPCGLRKTGYLRSELDVLITAHAAGASRKQLRTLVDALLAQRERYLAATLGELVGRYTSPDARTEANAQ